ncbi:hypothetical protein [Algoriphagus ornithinivorans]|nr:hypothetical protein [Algoriphagus ornithinivorans]
MKVFYSIDRRQLFALHEKVHFPLISGSYLEKLEEKGIELVVV